MTNNLFDFATSELSQDAVICWLANWADDSFSQNEPMHSYGRDFLASLLECWNEKSNGSIKLPASISIRIARGINDADVTLVINDKLAIFIEDKTGTSHHSNQLARCRQEASTSELYKGMEKVFIFFKTHDFIPDDYLRNSCFAIYDRTRLVTLLHGMKTDENCILNDFAQYIFGMENAAQAYRREKIEDWPAEAIPKFHSLIAQKIPGMNGGLANPMAGVPGCWGYEHCIPDVMCVYLQIVTTPEKPVKSNLYFRISEVVHPDQLPQIRKKWYECLQEAAKKYKAVIQKTVWRGGNTMNIAMLEGDFRAVDQNGVIDEAQTFDRLKLAQDILDEAVKLYK